MNLFEHAHAFVSRWEGGYVNHPADPGGTTNYGVSLRFLKQQGLDVGDVDEDGDIDSADIRKLTPERAAAILRRNFWDVFPLDNVPADCAIVIYDTAVNMGVGYAKKMAQQALGIYADGRWGNLTWKALHTCNDKKTAIAMCRIRIARYEALAAANPKLKPFLKGWKNRVYDLADYIGETL